MALARFFLLGILFCWKTFLNQVFCHKFFLVYFHFIFIILCFTFHSKYIKFLHCELPCLQKCPITSFWTLFFMINPISNCFILIRKISFLFQNCKYFFFVFVFIFQKLLTMMILFTDFIKFFLFILMFLNVTSAKYGELFRDYFKYFCSLDTFDVIFEL